MPASLTLKAPLLILAMFILCTSALKSPAQCGVYLRHASTQRFPYEKIHLDKAADMNGDGKVDLIATQNLGSHFRRDRILIIPNNGNGTFGSPTIINPPPGDFSYNYFIGRVDNNASNDIVAYPDFGGGQDPPTMIVYLNNGNGTFGAPVITNASPRGLVRELVDVNNDNKNDYIAFNGSGVFSYSLGNGDGTFGPPVTIATTGGIAGSVDFNNDGKIDFINGQRVFINNGDGTFTPTDLSLYGIASNEAPYLVRDLNGDGRTDMLVGTQDGWRRMLRRIDGGYDSTSYPAPPNPPGVQPLYQVGFFNGDPHIDILITYRLENRKILFALDATGAPIRSECDGRFYQYNFLNKVTADFDGDGREDMVQMTSNISNGTVMLPDVTSITFQKNVANRPGQPRIVEFDGSGNTDYSVWNPTTGDWTYRANPYDNETFETGTVNWGLGSFGDIPTPGDFDGDGITDRAVFRNSTGYWYIRRSSDLVWFVFRFGLTGDKPVVADYDGDTISDIAVWRPSDGNWYFWYMGSQTFGAAHFGSDGDKPAPADFDGDLKTDMAVFRPSTGVWYYLKSTDGNYVVVPWGVSEDKPIPADFDGDGKADIAVFRESTRFAYIVRSYNSTPAYYFFGNPGDILQVADYDGDFVADLGVYRPSSSFWLTTARRFMTFGAGNTVIPVSSMIRAE